ncbi:hypothetical protein [Haloarcula amylovorans]|uniref:hypothetical protein n=1 Tax=Haloarcula amylovorans TaxID=2562280 RepID=UPI001076A1F6|nr:hypothetical protein [Halomicroarcula amylolytica]
MENRITEAVAGGAFAFLAGALLWPPRAVYWTALSDRVGTAPTLALVALLAVAAGAAFSRTIGIPTTSLAAGGPLAYLVGMALVERAMTPDSPVHFLLYGALLCCLLVGSALASRFGTDADRRPAVGS